MLFAITPNDPRLFALAVALLAVAALAAAWLPARRAARINPLTPCVRIDELRAIHTPYGRGIGQSTMGGDMSQRGE
jgi:hypothetical protein